MIAYAEIYAAYQVIDAQLLRLESEAEARRDEWLKARRLNDLAYFLMLFAQFEQFINQQAKALVKQKKGQKGHERAWDIIDTKGFEDRYPFGHKVALLLGSDSHLTQEINDYYRVRCEIAHGGLPGIGLTNITDFAERIQELAHKMGKQGGATK